MKEQAEQAEAAAPVEARAPLAPVATPAAGRVLALQRAVGNRAVGAVLARDPTTVTKYVKEETTGADNVTWTASFDVEFDDDTKTCWLTIKVRLNPDGGIKEDDVTHTKIKVRSRFSLLWDSTFTLHEHRTILADRDWLLRPTIKFVDSGQHLTVALHPGKGADNRQNWYIGSPEWTHAHEISHQMGLLDEYADVSVPDRKVYTDNSIMGDYYNEGMTKAEAKLRHGERLASLIAGATGKDLKAHKR